MDKKIEKMAGLILKFAKICDCRLCQDCEYHKKGKFGKTSCQTIAIATELVKYYQEKIPENAVVLTITQKDEKFIDLLVEFDEMGFEPTNLTSIDMSVEEYTAYWKNRLLHTFFTAINNDRKEDKSTGENDK